MINVIGLGYIGLPTALMMASHGLEVIGTDIDTGRVAKLKKGMVTFKEEGLKDLFCRAMEAGIRFSDRYQTSDTYIISVPTPYDRNTKKIDTGSVTAAVRSVMDVCPTDAVIVIESTISPGTVDRDIRPLVGKKNIRLVHAPERIILGNMVYELIHNNRTIGADDPETGETVAGYYRSFCKGTITVTDIRTAEMTKVVENTYRAVNIAFANELARICNHEGMDVNEIIRICNMHPRVNILQPGPGVGGHCISVDPWFLVGDFPTLSKLTAEAMDVNGSMPMYVLSRIDAIMKEKSITDYGRVGLYGLSYKENVDDCRESPTLQLLDFQMRRGKKSIRVYDPMVPNGITPSQCNDFGRFLEDSDIVVIMVRHDHIRENMDRLSGKTVLDCCNICRLPGVYRI